MDSWLSNRFPALTKTKKKRERERGTSVPLTNFNSCPCLSLPAEAGEEKINGWSRDSPIQQSRTCRSRAPRELIIENAGEIIFSTREHIIPCFYFQPLDEREYRELASTIGRLVNSAPFAITSMMIEICFGRIIRYAARNFVRLIAHRFTRYDTWNPTYYENSFS